MTKTGATANSTGQGPYDGIDDTLVGVVNNGTIPIKVLKLTSGENIFGFDGDGIDTYGVPGNAKDSTGYGGPNAYYTNINASQTSGSVNFITPIPANGGTSYFSLENAVSNAVACQTVLNKGLSGPMTSGRNITATFSPKLNYSPQSAAQLCGFTNLDWQQTITSWPAPSPLFQLNNNSPLHTPPPFLDPVPGGYTYTGAIHDYPFYFDATNNSPTKAFGLWLNLDQHETNTTLDFGDSPADPCLPGGTGCGGKTAPKGSVLMFKTELVGVNADYTATDLGIGFTWKSNFNGTSGGTARTLNPSPTDPGSGTGGTTILSVTDTTTYNYDGFSVTAVNPTVITGSQPGALIVTGQTTVVNAQIAGAVVVEQGASLTLENSTVGGSVTAVDDPGSIQICSTTVDGATTITNAASLYLGIAGDPNCGPNNFSGAVNVT